MCAVIFACHNRRGGGGRECYWLAVGAESVLSHTEWSGPNQRGTLAWMEHFHQGETGLLRRAPVVLSLSPHARARCQHRSPAPPPPSLSIFYSSPLHTHTPVPLASRPPRHSIAGATSPRVLSPLSSSASQGLQTACQAGVSRWLHEASETELPAALGVPAH